MQVQRAGTSRNALMPDDVASVYGLTFGNQDLGEVGVIRENPVAVIDDDQVTIDVVERGMAAEIVFGPDNRAGTRHKDVGLVRSELKIDRFGRGASVQPAI